MFAVLIAGKPISGVQNAFRCSIVITICRMSVNSFVSAEIDYLDQGGPLQTALVAQMIILTI
jgi:hypothetical protein